MRRILLGTLILTACVAATRVQTQMGLDDAVRVFVVPNPLPVCGLATAILHLEQSANVRLGFERSPECPDNPNLFPDLAAQNLDNLSGKTLRQILDHLVGLDPNFDWREMNSVAVVRPVNAWNDGTDALNAQVEPFTIADGQLTDAVAVAVRSANLQVTRVGAESTANRRFSVQFPGGTMLEALNAVIRAHGAAVWETQSQAGQAVGSGGTTPPADIMVRTFDASGSGFAAPVKQAPAPKKRAR